MPSPRRTTSRRHRTRVIALSAVTVALVAALAAPAAARAVPAASRDRTAALDTAALSRDVDTPVIVLLKDQPPAAAKGTAAAAARTDALTRVQAPLLRELSQVHATKVHGFHVIDGVAATVSKAEAARLATEPDVASVVPDTVLSAAPRQQAATGNGSAKAAGPQDTVPSGTCPAAGTTMLEPEALADTHTDSDDPSAKTARSLGFTGSGVKVGYLAEGIDVNNPDFVRADGSKVFADYKDFTGEGPDAPTTGGESFIDASAIAAQGRETYNVQDFGSPALPDACDIRIEGMAPGVQLYGYKTFGYNDLSTVSEWVQAIDYAVDTDHVDVLNESVVWQPYPDNGAMNVLKMANDAAVNAGVTVVAGSGDAGSQNTEAVPATDPAVIAAGASTTFRWYEQTNYAGARQFSTGWLDDNVSSLSSSGFDQDGRTIDLLAPGDGSFALCTADTAQYAECTDPRGDASDVLRSGGTSQAAPLTAGAAALVIQAYRQAHGGASPAPALVKEILTSTADDLTVPSQEQGAGLLDSYRAVQAALSIHDGNGSPAATGSSLVFDQSQLDATGVPGSRQSWTVDVTNTGSATQTLSLMGRAFGPAQNVQNATTTLSDSGSHFTDWSGVEQNDTTTTFTVPSGASRLDASIAYQAPSASGRARVYLDLIDPSGRLANDSLPQGVSDYGHADVRLPAVGTWKAVVFSPVSASGGTTGTVHLQFSTADTTSLGTVSPSALTLAAGASAPVTVTAPIPTTAGDGSGALVVTGSGGQHSALPIILRGLVQPDSGGAFAGTLSGGNGRQTGTGQIEYYQFDVPSGEKDLDVGVKLTNDAADTVEALLIDPAGETGAIGTNQLTTAYDPATRSGSFTAQPNTDLYARAPQAGRWTLIVKFPGEVAGDETSQTFTGTVSFDKVEVTGSAASAELGGRAIAPGTPVAVTVPVTNTGTAPEDFFLDPRLATSATVGLAAAEPATGLKLPLTYADNSPAWLVPAETTTVGVHATATVPVTFDYGPESGDPDLSATATGTTASGSTTGSPLPAGVWGADPSEFGPYDDSGAPAATADMTATATTRAFDPTVVPDATDLWQSAVTPATSMKLVTLQPGQSTVLTAEIKPTAPAGTTVSGTLFVDMLAVGSTASLNGYNYNDYADTEPSADELAAVPYNYTVS